MQFRRMLFFVFVLTILNSAWNPSFSQVLYSSETDAWVDSVFGTMSITERIDQLLLVELDSTSPTAEGTFKNYGGIRTSESNLDLFRNITDRIPETGIRPLIFHDLGDPIGMNLDAIDRFGSLQGLGMISEPHIFYELGSAIAQQCSYLGIHAIDHGNHDLNKLFGEDGWKLTELNQGLMDSHILPMNALSIYDYRQDSSDLVDQLFSWDLIKILPQYVDRVHRIFQNAVLEDDRMVGILEGKCKKVLAYKRWVGMNKNLDIDEIEKGNLINDPDNLLLRYEMTKYQLVVTGGGDIKIPIQRIEHVKVAQLSIGENDSRIFNAYSNKYTKVDFYETDYVSSDEEYASLWLKLKDYDIIICTYYGLNQVPHAKEEIEGFMIFNDWIKSSGKLLSVTFLNQHEVSNEQLRNNISGGLIVLDDDSLTNALAPQVIFGGIEAHGKLSISNGDYIKGYIGSDVNAIHRFSYTLPEAVGLDSEKLKSIDSIANAAIKAKATPGCQILIAKDNQVIYQKAFGYHTYDSIRKVSNTDLYDLASVTKVSGALPCLMKLYEERKFDLEATMGTYLPYFKRRSKKELTYREILAHQSGLFPYIVYWKNAIKKNGKFRRKTFSNEKSEDFSYELSPGLYLHNEFKSKIYKQIRKSKLGDKKYNYSGLSFLLYPEIIETITGQAYDDYLYENFYKPLGAHSITYNPLEKFEIDKITPTEYDSLFRKTLVRGKVHDEAAAVMAGISSNAGLFANANDLAKLFQMYCNYGTYGNREYLNEETLLEFTRCQYPENDNRRGLGFDRPLPEPHENGNTAKSVSQLSFGHSGFTGTYAWADPEYNLVYIFLSNRVYQTRENRKLYELNIRTDIQDIIYDAMNNQE